MVESIDEAMRGTTMEPIKDVMARTAHIPDAEVRKDILDTEFELRSLEARQRLLTEELASVNIGIHERQAFIHKLRALLHAREATRAL